MTTASTIAQLEQPSSLDELTAVLVPRVSSERDGSKSVDDQIDLMTQACVRQGWRIAAIYEERDVSGTRTLDKRHGLKRAVEDIEAGRAQIVLTAYFDRFVRSVATKDEVLTRVEAAGGRVTTLDFGDVSNATAMQWFSATQNAAFAEFYARQVAEKTHASKQRNINKGVPPFPRITPAYVRRADGTIEPHETNAPLIAEACRMRSEGKSFAVIRDWLAENGVDVTLSRMHSMLTSKLLIGEIHFGKFEPNLNSHEAIIDRATHRKLCSMRATRGRHAKSERLLARQSVLFCKTCAARMTAASSKGNGTKTYSYYRCAERCSNPASVPCEIVEDAVRDRAIELSKQIKGRASVALELEAARLDFETAQSKLASTIELLVDLIAEPSTKQTLDLLQADRDEKKARHDRLLARSTPDRTATSLSAWNVMTLDERRSLVRSVVERVDVDADDSSFEIVAHLLS